MFDVSFTLSVTLIVAPFPGALFIEKAPPSLRTRSAIPVRPNPCLNPSIDGTTAGLKPWPLSDITNSTPPLNRHGQSGHLATAFSKKRERVEASQNANNRAELWVFRQI
jgi:hypothetical protein